MIRHRYRHRLNCNLYNASWVFRASCHFGWIYENVNQIRIRHIQWSKRKKQWARTRIANQRELSRNISSWRETRALQKFCGTCRGFYYEIQAQGRGFWSLVCIWNEWLNLLQAIISGVHNELLWCGCCRCPATTITADWIFSLCRDLGLCVVVSYKFVRIDYCDWTRVPCIENASNLFTFAWTRYWNGLTEFQLANCIFLAADGMFNKYIRHRIDHNAE